MSSELQKAWVCTVCGYVHYGPEPPEECPVCGADAGAFELEAAPQDASAGGDGSSQPITIVIIGAGIAGVSAAEACRQASPDSNIQLISSEKDLPYYRLNLTRFLAGEISAEQLPLHSQEWYTQNRIDLHLGMEVLAIHPEQKTVETSSGDSFVYDRLVLATGAHPFVPPVTGSQLGKVFTLRTLQNALDILKECSGAEVVCIGGGLLGLETAGALVRRGAKVTILEALNWLMPRQLNQAASSIFQAYIERIGIRVRTAVKVKDLQGSTDVSAVSLEDGTVLPAGMVIFSAGVRSNLALARNANLAMNLGVAVSDGMLTSDADIYAAGDVAEHAGVMYGTWFPAQAQGNIAGTSAAGRSAAFRRVPPSAVLKVLGIDLFSAGRITAEADDFWIEESGIDNYKGFLFHQGALVGAILLGDASGSTEVKKAIENSLDCAKFLAGNPEAGAVLEHLVRTVSA